jgi:hypothetical protein
LTQINATQEEGFKLNHWAPGKRNVMSKLISDKLTIRGNQITAQVFTPVRGPTNDTAPSRSAIATALPSKNEKAFAELPKLKISHHVYEQVRISDCGVGSRGNACQGRARPSALRKRRTAAQRALHRLAPSSPQRRRLMKPINAFRLGAGEKVRRYSLKISVLALHRR